MWNRIIQVDGSYKLSCSASFYSNDSYPLFSLDKIGARPESTRPPCKTAAERQPRLCTSIIGSCAAASLLHCNRYGMLHLSPLVTVQRSAATPNALQPFMPSPPTGCSRSTAVLGEKRIPDTPRVRAVLCITSQRRHQHDTFCKGDFTFGLQVHTHPLLLPRFWELTTAAVVMHGIDQGSL